MAMDGQGPGFESGALAKIRTLYDENLAYADAIYGTRVDTLEAMLARGNQLPMEAEAAALLKGTSLGAALAAAPAAGAAGRASL